MAAGRASPLVPIAEPRRSMDSTGGRRPRPHAQNSNKLAKIGSCDPPPKPMKEGAFIQWQFCFSSRPVVNSGTTGLHGLMPRFPRPSSTENMGSEYIGFGVHTVPQAMRAFGL